MILADSREDKVIPFFKDVEVINNMKTGDYAIVYDNTILHVFERKTMSDLSTSINTNNMHIDQMIWIREKTKCKLSYIIESPKVFHQKKAVVARKAFNQLSAMLDTIFLEHGISIIYTRDPAYTARRLEEIAERYIKLIDECRIEVSGGTIDALNQKKDVAIETRVEKLWRSLPGVGPQMAKTLMCLSIRSILTYETTLDQIEFMECNNKAIGSRFNTAYSRLIEPESEHHVKLLASIYGLSKHRAFCLLQQVSLLDLSDVEKTATLAELTVDGRRLGSMAKRICKYLTYSSSSGS